MRARDDGLGNITGIANAAVGDQGHTLLCESLGHFGNRRYLRYTDARNDSRRAD